MPEKNAVAGSPEMVMRGHSPGRPGIDLPG
jgi:hypothetical protein